MKGTCLCEAIAYEIEGEFGPIFNCHCSKCRRWHGAAFRTRGSIDSSQFSIVRGSEYLAGYKSSDNVTKHFCRSCGSPLHSTYADRPEVIGVPLGGVEGVEQLADAHIFVDDKATWHRIDDELPQYPAWPGDEANVRKTTRSES